MPLSLGRGLQSLIPKKRTRQKGSKQLFGLMDVPQSHKESVFNIEIDKIKPNASQPRKTMREGSLTELAASIREHGVLQPIIVTKSAKETDRGCQVEYELIAGERRWRASKLVGLPHIPAIVRDGSAKEKLEVALVENIQRKNLNPIELALAFKRLHKEFGLTQKVIADRVGKGRVTVTNTIRLLNLGPKVQRAIVDEKISEGHGRALLMAKPEMRLALFAKLLREKWNIRRTEEEARKLAIHPVGTRGRTPVKSLFYRELQQGLSKAMGHQVSIYKRGNVGRLTIEFADKADLAKITDYLMRF